MDLWELIHTRQQFDPDEVASAIERQAAEPELDYRTRMLIGEATQGLRGFWGDQRFEDWIAGAAHRERIAECASTSYDKVGFPSLPKRIQVVTRKETILRFLRDVGAALREPAHIIVGGSSALIMSDLLLRHTEDVDVVDELPEPLRHLTLEGHPLKLAHFQSHYLPAGWERRIRSLGAFGRLTVDVVDPIDIAAGKLLSRREKDRQDLLVLRLPPEQLRERVESSPSHLSDARLVANLDRNWYVLFGETFTGAEP